MKFLAICFVLCISSHCLLACDASDPGCEDFYETEPTVAIFTPVPDPISTPDAPAVQLACNASDPGCDD